MHCPFCQAVDTKVVDSRLGGEGDSVRRRRECLECEARFTTYEMAELSLPRVIKRDSTRQTFDEEKLKKSFLKALEKCPVSLEQVDDCVARIRRNLRGFSEKEVPSGKLGEWVMDELRQLDDVAYVRYASVYRRFKDVNEFREEIERLQSLAVSEEACNT